MNSDHFTVNNESGLFEQHLLTHTVKKLSVNTQINDLIALKYNETEEVPFQLYNENPIKLSFWNQLKNRTFIQNFIVYQYSIKAKTFVERKLLKTTKSHCCRNMITYKLKNFTFFFLMSTFLVGHPGLKKNILLCSLLGIWLFSDGYWWLRNNRNIMLNYQINSFFKLGKESKEFICFIENEGFGMLEENQQEHTENKGFLSFLSFRSVSRLIKGNKNDEKKEKFMIEKDKKTGLYLIFDNKNGNLKAQFSRHPAYYKKFSVKEIFDIKFEPEDEIVDYLNMDLNYDFHKEYLKKLSRSQSYFNDSPRDLLSLIR